MNPHPAPPLRRKHPEPGGPWIFRLALTWFAYVFAVVSLGISMQSAFIGYQSVAPDLQAVASGLSTVRSALAGAGIHGPIEFLRLS